MTYFLVVGSMLPTSIVNQIIGRLTNPSGCWRDYNALHDYWVALKYEVSKGNIRLSDLPDEPSLSDFNNLGCVFSGPSSISASYEEPYIRVSWESVWGSAYYVIHRAIDDNDFEIYVSSYQSKVFYDTPTVSGRYLYRVYAANKADTLSTASSDAYVDVDIV